MAVGQAVVVGQTLAGLEADKAVVDLASPADGVVEQLHVRVGDRVQVDTPLLTLRVADSALRHRQPSAERDDIPHLTAGNTPCNTAGTTAGNTAGTSSQRPRARALASASATHPVLMQGLGSARGRLRLDNRELAEMLPTLAATGGPGNGIFERTGIESRTVAGPGQDAVSMAVDAARKALADAGLDAQALSLIICSTSTPLAIAPSTACQVLQRLAPSCEMPAYDVQAACSGYLYALAQAWDFLQQQQQHGNVLVITTEVMRGIVDIRDPQTSPIFADAATATVLSCTTAVDGPRRPLARLRRPVISARGDNSGALTVPLPGQGMYVQMDGRRVFTEAVRGMQTALAAACRSSGVALDALDLVVPHQANGRIIDALRARLKWPEHKVWNEIRLQGNTSSSSIPLALDTVLRADTAIPRHIGLCAFGAGFTTGAAVLSTMEA